MHGIRKSVHSEQLIGLADFAQYLTVAVTLSGYVPQIRRLLLLRSAEEMSLLTWVVWSFGSFLAFFYALAHSLIDGCCFPLLCTSTVNLLFSIAVLVLIVRLRRSRSIAEIPSHRRACPVDRA